MASLTKPSKVTSKNQATIPKEIRKALGIEKGDRIVYEILPDNTVVLRKSYPVDFEYLEEMNRSLTEWESEEDEKAYKDI